MINPVLDRLMLEASAAAYKVVLNSDGVTATLTGADPQGVAYTFDSSGIITNTGLVGYKVDRAFIDASTGFKAVAFINPISNDRIIAFAGTEDVQDWANNLTLGWTQWTEGTVNGQNILNYIQDAILQDGNINIDLTGHSLGGGLAEYAAYFAKKIELKARETNPAFTINLALTTFNAMGVLSSLELHEGPDRYAVNNLMKGVAITHYRQQDDLVSLLGGHVGDTVLSSTGVLESNVYDLGTDPLFLYPAHLTSALYSENLASARNINNPINQYFDIDDSQPVAAEIITSSTKNVTDPKQLLQAILTALSEAVEKGEGKEVNALMDWVVKNAYDSGKIDSLVYNTLSGTDWAHQYREGILGPILSAAYQGYSAWGKVSDTFDAVKWWAGSASSELFNNLGQDLQRFTQALRLLTSFCSGWQKGTTFPR